MQQAKIRNLPKAEKERRWRQSQNSKASSNIPSQRNYRTPKGKTLGTLASQHMSKCGRDYMMALTHPFGLKHPVCVPDFHSLPSKKVRCKTRTTFTTGSDGNGFVILCAWCNGNTGGGIYASTAAWTGANFPNTLTDANTVAIAQPKLPYDLDLFETVTPNPGVQARTVGVGIRVRYTGPSLYRSGQIYAIRHPDNETLVGKDFDEAMAYSTGKSYHNRGQWINLYWRPAAPNDYQFSPSPTEPLLPIIEQGIEPKFELGFAFRGTTEASGTLGSASFEVEVIRFVEYIGQIDNISHSHTDINSMSHIRNSLPTKSSTDNAHHTFQKSVKAVEDSIGESLPEVAGGALAYRQLTAPAAEEGSGFFTSLLEGGTEIVEGAAEALPYLAEAAPFLLL